MCHDEYYDGSRLIFDGSWKGKSGRKWIEDSKEWWHYDSSGYLKIRLLRLMA